MSILVAGGAGYIGSHTVRALLERGEQVLVLDDLREGHRAAVPDSVPLIEVDLQDRAATLEAIAEHQPEAVFHFAASCYVGESVTDPGSYYQNNFISTLNLLDGMVAAGSRRFIFSSTCATYGEPPSMPITEEMPKEPVNPYGRTKLFCEGALADYEVAHGIQSVSLRYFNAAGAHPSGELGEDHAPETHLIPLVLQVALGQREDIKIFGTDYDTPDGTCIRDYIHIVDLAEAHILGLEALREGRITRAAFNLGNEEGHSVRQVIEMSRKITGHPIPAVETGRRAGDPPRLVGSSELARKVLGWQPRFGDLESILETAWNWHRLHPQGYGSATGEHD